MSSYKEKRKEKREARISLIGEILGCVILGFIFAFVAYGIWFYGI